MATSNQTPASIQELLREENQIEALKNEAPLSFWHIAIIRIRRDKLTMAALSVLLIILVTSLMYGPISRALEIDAFDTNLADQFEPPSAKHLLGADDLGQDQFARLIYAARISLSIGFFSAFFILTIGITLGMIAAYFGGIVDDLIMWLINTLNSIPQLYLLLILGALFDITPVLLVLIFGFTAWPFTTRLVRSQVYSLREREYVMASTALGASSVYTIMRHILPNVIPTVIIVAARAVGNLMLAEAILSFIGFGVRPPTPTWGNMLTKSQQYVFEPDKYYLILPAGIMITITVLCVFIIGDGLRDALDPKLK
ncbi:MAG: peptide/nickel transport system permease protein [Cellvibrionaceae bacterium]|jgi:peptide/nickel transport system permease protein